MRIAFWDMERLAVFVGYGGLYWGLRYAAQACRAAGLEADLVQELPRLGVYDYLVIGDQRLGSRHLESLLEYRYVVQVHGYLWDVYNPQTESLSPRFRRLWDAASALVAVSTGLERDLMRWLDRPIWQIWNCADDQMFRRRRIKRTKDLIAVGALIPRKRPDRLNKLEFPVDLYGKSHRRGYQASMAENVSYQGPIEHDLLPETLSKYKVFIHVAEREECPLVVVEAMLTGLPVVGMDAGDMKDVVGPAGVVVPQGDIQGLNDAVREVLDNWEVYHRNALGRAERFTPEFIGSRWRMLFEHLEAVNTEEAKLTEKQSILLSQVARARKRKSRAEKKDLDVSVVIPCFNMAHFLPEAIESVQRQTFKNWEIVVVDDGSTDNIAAVETKYKKRGKVRFIHQANQGLAEARNAGIAEAQGRWIFPLDADDFLHETALAKLVAMAKLNPHSVIYGDLWLHYKDGDKRWYLRDYDFADLLKRDCMPPCALFPKKAWEESGGYKHLGAGYEDWEFWITLGELGYYGVHIRQPVYWYRMKDKSMWREALKVHDDLYEKIAALHLETYAKHGVEFVFKTKVTNKKGKKHPAEFRISGTVDWHKKVAKQRFEKLQSPAVLLRYLGSDPPHAVTGPVTQKKYSVRAGRLMRVAIEDVEQLLTFMSQVNRGHRIFELVE